MTPTAWHGQRNPGRGGRGRDEASLPAPPAQIRTGATDVLFKELAPDGHDEMIGHFLKRIRRRVMSAGGTVWVLLHCLDEKCGNRG